MRSFAFCTTLLLATLLAAQSQPGPSTSLHLAAVKLTGSQRYTAKDVEVATGLHGGQQVRLQDLMDAARKLGKSGVFLLVDYEFVSTPAGIEVTFKALDNLELARPLFENLVWLSPEDLDRTIRKSVPLYKGEVPGAGTMSNEIADVLQDSLRERGVISKIAIEPRGAPGKTLSAVAFRAADVNPVVDSVRFTGVSNVDPRLLDKEAQSMVGSDYQASMIVLLCNSFAKKVYTARGFLSAAFDLPQYAIVRDDPHSPGVAVTIPVREGTPYTVQSLSWSGNSIFSEDALNAAIRLQIGQTANLPQYEDDIKYAHKMYASHGYLRVRFDVQPELLPEKRVSITIHVNEGKQYKTGQLVLRGLPESAQRELLSKWKPIDREALQRILCFGILRRGRAAAPLGLPVEVPAGRER